MILTYDSQYLAPIGLKHDEVTGGLGFEFVQHGSGGQ
jgi:hypothetical protein